MARCLVTGANGFLGSHIVEELLRRGHDVACLVRKTSDLRYIEGLEVELVYGEMRDPDSLRSAVEAQEVVIHAAGVTRAFYPRQHYEINTHGTVEMLKACIDADVDLKKFVYVSSQAAAGPSPDGKPIDEDRRPRPVSAYGKSKWLAERYVTYCADSLPVTIVRPSAVYGPRDYDGFGYFRDASRHLSEIVGFRRSLLNITYVSDVVDGIVLAAESDASTSRTYFIADDRPHSWEEIAREIAGVLGVRTINLRVSGETVKAISRTVVGLTRLGKSLGFCRKPPLLTIERGIELSKPYWVCDCGRAKRELGFEPRVDFKEGVRLTAEWYRKAGWL